MEMPKAKVHTPRNEHNGQVIAFRLLPDEIDDMLKLAAPLPAGSSKHAVAQSIVRDFIMRPRPLPTLKEAAPDHPDASAAPSR